MLAQPAWVHRLDEILADLQSMTSTHLDRRAVEKLFRVRRRRARQIMAGLEGLRVGNAAAVSREALIARLERTAAAGVFQWEGNRRARVVDALDLARRQLAAQHVRIPAAADVREQFMKTIFLKWTSSFASHSIYLIFASVVRTPKLRNFTIASRPPLTGWELSACDILFITKPGQQLKESVA